jgi:hypothetical protein
MNNWHNEFMAEYRRQELWEEAEQIRLEKIARESRVQCPNRFERIMFTFASWMISKGKQLRKRYTRSTPHSGSVGEATTVNCGDHPQIASQING